MTSNNIRIIPADPKYARGMQNVYYKTWLATYPNKEHGITIDDIEKEFEGTLSEESLNKVRERLSNPKDTMKVFLALDGENVVGVCRVLLEPDRNHLKTLYVLPEYQGKGIGTMLWTEAKKLFDPNKPTTLDVVTYNAHAIEYYKRLGFEDTGERFTEERFRMPSGNIMPEMRMKLKS